MPLPAEHEFEDLLYGYGEVTKGNEVFGLVGFGQAAAQLG